jgi:hypothetical protein
MARFCLPSSLFAFVVMWQRISNYFGSPLLPGTWVTDNNLQITPKICLTYLYIPLVGASLSFGDVADEL